MESCNRARVARLVHFCTSVCLNAGRDQTRDRELAVDGDYFHVHARVGLCRRLHYVQGCQRSDGMIINPSGRVAHTSHRPKFEQMHEEWSYNSRVHHARRDGCLHAWQLTKGVKSYMRFWCPSRMARLRACKSKSTSSCFPSTLASPRCGVDIKQQVKQSQQEICLLRLARCEAPHARMHVHGRLRDCLTFSRGKQAENDF